VGSGGSEYFLGDALESMQQLGDGVGEVTLEIIYDPYGSVLESSGDPTFKPYSLSR